MVVSIGTDSEAREQGEKEREEKENVKKFKIMACTSQPRKGNQKIRPGI